MRTAIDLCVTSYMGQTNPTRISQIKHEADLCGIDQPTLSSLDIFHIT